MASRENYTQGAGSTLVKGLGMAMIFAVATTNTIVYARGTTSSGDTSGSGDGENEAVSANCALLMLAINVILAIVSFIAMVYYMYRTFTPYDTQNRNRDRVGNALLYGGRYEGNIDRGSYVGHQGLYK